MSEKSIVSVAIAFSVCFIALLWFLNQNKTPTTSKACTMEAKLCPDGSAVGRSGPNCDFAPCPNIASSPTPISDTTSNWKTCTDLKNNFELNYPSSWNPSEEALLETGDYFFLSSPNQSIFRVNIVQDSSKSISDYLSKTDKQNLTGYEGTPSITVLSTKITTINNLSCVQRQESYNAAGFSVYSTYYKFGNNIIVLTLQPKAGEINPNDIAVYQQILSTFKFTESKAESNTEKQIGYIKRVYSKNGNSYLTVDYVQWQSCENCPNGYKVVNDNIQLRDLQLSSNLDIKLIYLTQTAKKVSISDFTKLINNPTSEYPTDQVLYWLTFDKSGNVSEIDEQYQP